MELSKKTTILFPPDLHERLARLAEMRGVSLGALVREACAEHYGLRPAEDRLAAVIDLHGLEGIVSYDRDFDAVEGLRRIEPTSEGG